MMHFLILYGYRWHLTVQNSKRYAKTSPFKIPNGMPRPHRSPLIIYCYTSPCMPPWSGKRHAWASIAINYLKLTLQFFSWQNRLHTVTVQFAKHLTVDGERCTVGEHYP